MWATAIFEYRKPFEYRRSPPVKDTPYRAALYASDDVQAIVGEAYVAESRTRAVDELIEATVAPTPHDPGDLRAYFTNKEEGTALALPTARRYTEPVSLEEVNALAGSGFPPQNFRYLRPERDGALRSKLASIPLEDPMTVECSDCGRTVPVDEEGYAICYGTRSNPHTKRRLRQPCGNCHTPTLTELCADCGAALEGTAFTTNWG
jgi:predicted transcriptional regulator